MPWRAIVPALLTRMCSPPNSADASPRPIDPVLSRWPRREPGTAPVHRPAALRAKPRRQRLAVVLSTSVSITAAPSRTNNSASATPCPPAAPVISATFPSSLAIVVLPPWVIVFVIEPDAAADALADAAFRNGRAIPAGPESRHEPASKIFQSRRTISRRKYPLRLQRFNLLQIEPKSACGKRAVWEVPVGFAPLASFIFHRTCPSRLTARERNHQTAADSAQTLSADRTSLAPVSRSRRL